MQTQPSPTVLRVGARCPLGLNRLQVAMSWRARKLEPRRAPWRDKRGHYAGVVRARFLPDDLYGFERFVALGAPALAEAAGQLQAAIPLFVGLPEPTRPDDDPRYAESLLGELGRRAGVALDLSSSVLVRQGHASFATALEMASQKLLAGAPAVAVGAIDSHFHPEVVGWLDEACRLHAPKTEDGVIPSEGAAFALLGAADATAGGKPLQGLFPTAPPTPIATVRCVGTAADESALEPEAPLLAQVMTELVQQAARCVPQGVEWILSDINGEYYRVKEWSRVEVRSEELPELVRHDRVADGAGDVGAASGALALALACTLWETQCAPASQVLVALHSDGAERGVFVVETANADSELADSRMGQVQP